MRDAIALGAAQRIAVLVDADNASAEQIAFAVSRAGTFGAIVLKRAFGRLSSIVGKADILAQHGFTAEVTFPPQGNGKNAADLMLAQYATRLAERRVVETVALVSSDGDFAPVATGLSEAGVRTIGFGRQETPAALRDACAPFIPFPVSQPATPTIAKQDAIPQSARARLTKIINEEMDGGRVHLSVLGNRLKVEFGKNYNDLFGGKRVSQFMADLDGFAIVGNGPHKEWVIRSSVAQSVNRMARSGGSG